MTESQEMTAGMRVRKKYRRDRRKGREVDG
jgi:hypothetical protein